MNVFRHSRRIFYVFTGVAALAASGLFLHHHFRSRSLCEAVSDGASLEELTHMLVERGVRLNTAPNESYAIIDYSERPGCSVEFRGGRVISAQANSASAK
jgi:hypothetical protein